MIIILLNWLFNGFLLGIIYWFAGLFFHKSVPPEHWLFFGYGVTTALMLIGASKMGVYLIRLYLGARSPIASEWQKIEPSLFEVITQVNKTKKTMYLRNKINIMLFDSKIADSYAIGDDTILLADGLLNTATEDELKAVITHELGHLHNKDSLILTMLIFGGLATQIVGAAYSLYLSFLNVLKFLASKFGNKGLHLMPFIAFIPFVIFLPVVIINWVARQLLDISLRFMCRIYYYKADKFVKDVGYTQGLISYLETEHIVKAPNNSFFERIYRVHPLAMKRISKLKE